jgi:O-antigen/teichoic acid export membrane protein
MRGLFSLFVLKGLNAALTAVSNFVLAYVLVRTLGLDSYAIIASLLAIAALVLQSDLGIGGLAFFKLRSHYLEAPNGRVAHRDDQDLVATIVAVYVAIGIIAVAMVGVALIVGVVPVKPHGVAYLLIFAGAVCALPRMALRVAINARDGFIWTEAVDLGRRIALLGVTIAMLLGLSFVAYGAVSLSVWVLSIVVMLWLAHVYGFTLKGGAVLRGLRLLKREVRGVRATVLLSLADFMITMFPYYLLSATREASAIVAFDMFYKVTRFAAMSYMIGAETVLPHQTRAVHSGNGAGLGRATAIGFTVGLLPMSVGIVAIAVFGEKIFGVILNHNGIVTPIMRTSICAMLVFMLIQTTCSIVLIGVGKFEALASRACVTLAGMLLISTLMVLFHWSIDIFIVSYVVVYGLGALLYAECWYSLNRSLWTKSGQIRTVEA